MKMIEVPENLHGLVEALRADQACVESTEFELERAEVHVRSLKAFLAAKKCVILEVSADIRNFIKEVPADKKKGIIEEFDIEDLFSSN